MRSTLPPSPPERSSGLEEVLLILVFALLASAGGSAAADCEWLETRLHTTGEPLRGHPEGGRMRLNLTMREVLYVQVDEEAAIAVPGDWCQADFEARVVEAVGAATKGRTGPFETVLGAREDTPICAFFEVQEAFALLEHAGVASGQIYLAARHTQEVAR